MASVSIVNYAGRMFDKPIEPNKDGLLAIINYTSGASTYAHTTPSLTQAKSVSFNS